MIKASQRGLQIKGVASSWIIGCLVGSSLAIRLNWPWYFWLPIGYGAKSIVDFIFALVIGARQRHEEWEREAFLVALNRSSDGYGPEGPTLEQIAQENPLSVANSFEPVIWIKRK